MSMSGAELLDRIETLAFMLAELQEQAECLRSCGSVCEDIPAARAVVSQLDMLALCSNGLCNELSVLLETPQK